MDDQGGQPTSICAPPIRIHHKIESCVPSGQQQSGYPWMQWIKDQYHDNTEAETGLDKVPQAFSWGEVEVDIN